MHSFLFYDGAIVGRLADTWELTFLGVLAQIQLPELCNKGECQVVEQEPPTTTTKRAEISRCRVKGRKKGKYGIYLDKMREGAAFRQNRDKHNTRADDVRG